MKYFPCRKKKKCKKNCLYSVVVTPRLSRPPRRHASKRQKQILGRILIFNFFLCCYFFFYYSHNTYYTAYDIIAMTRHYINIHGAWWKRIRSPRNNAAHDDDVTEYSFASTLRALFKWCVSPVLYTQLSVFSCSSRSTPPPLPSIPQPTMYPFIVYIIYVYIWWQSRKTRCLGGGREKF